VQAAQRDHRERVAVLFEHLDPDERTQLHELVGSVLATLQDRPSEEAPP
jgi:hypothetical protein